MIEGNWTSLSTKQKELILEIGNAILEIAGLDKLVTIGGALKKIHDLRESENNFKNKIIQEILTMGNMDEDVLRAAVDVLKSEITSESMLRYRGKESEFLNEICEKHKFSFSVNRTQFKKLMKKIVKFCSQNAEELISHEKLAVATYDVVRDTGDMLRNTNDKLSERFDQIVDTPASITNDSVRDNHDMVQDANDKLSEILNKIEVITHTKEVSLKHDNFTYKCKFTAPFFLEEEMPENEGICSLSSVFVEPVLTRNPALTLERKLEGWSTDYDRTSGKRSDAMYSVFLLYGKAGVGKSNYIAKLINTQPFGKNWLALELRSCANRLKSADAWESVKVILGADDDDAYKDSILILDGLDEVCVLYPDFDGKVFIENLQNENALKTKNIKILITSREGYFGNITQKNNLLMDTIQWTEEQVGEWCKKYCTAHKSRVAWAEKFMADYRKLPEYDERRAIFCIPIILYFCCVREIDIGSESTMVGIYEKAFRTVGERRHNPTTDTEMQKDDERTFAVNWQYTKELVYQIFLDGKNPIVLENDGIQVARKHTVNCMGECRSELDRYFAFFPFASEKKEEGKTKRMKFAHKTMIDYFTAVKLYEDYFEKVLDKADPAKALWQGLWRAFRYKEMPDGIIRYLVQIIENRQGKNYDAYRRQFFECYYNGVKTQIIWQLLDAPEYKCEMAYDRLPQQVGLVFRNLTYLLNGMNYVRFERTPDSAYTNHISTFFHRGVKMDVWCFHWKGLRGTDLSGADLSFANLWGADLWGTALYGSNLSGADLRGSDLSIADLRSSDLSNANLSDANLSSVIWSENQILRNIGLWDTDLPQLDEAIEKYGIRLIDPIVRSRKTGRILKYTPQTNRAEEE